jgi:hypothetical protein
MNTLWTPAQVDITGNELADTMAKIGAPGNSRNCAHICTTKTWFLAETRWIFLSTWKSEPGWASSKLPLYTRSLKFGKSRALFRLFCHRTPTDPRPQDDPEPCPCRDGNMTSSHLFVTRKRFDHGRHIMETSTTGAIDTHDFLLEPDNVAPIITFLKKTGIWFTKSLRCDHSDEEEMTETEGDDGEIGDLEVEAFEE